MFLKVVWQHTQGQVGLLITSIVQIYPGFFWWKKWKSVKVWQNCGHEFVASLVGPPCSVYTTYRGRARRRVRWAGRRCCRSVCRRRRPPSCPLRRRNRCSRSPTLLHWLTHNHYAVQFIILGLQRCHVNIIYTIQIVEFETTRIRTKAIEKLHKASFTSHELKWTELEFANCERLHK